MNATRIVPLRTREHRSERESLPTPIFRWAVYALLLAVAAACVGLFGGFVQ